MNKLSQKHINYLAEILIAYEDEYQYERTYFVISEKETIIYYRTLGNENTRIHHISHNFMVREYRNQYLERLKVRWLRLKQQTSNIIKLCK